MTTQSQEQFEPWQAPPCRIRIIDDAEDRWVELERPYALIGSHRCCDIQIGGSSSIPPVAYFVCCLPDSVEVWPTAAIAFPRWGAIRPDVELLVGQSRITVHHPNVDLNNTAQLPFLSDSIIDTSMTWPGKSITKSFRRPVTIVGDTHPSVLRLHGRGMHKCHFAAVTSGETLWMVNISPTNLTHEQRVRSLTQAGDSTRCGDVVVEFIEARRRGGGERSESSTHALQPLHPQLNSTEPKGQKAAKTKKKRRPKEKNQDEAMEPEKPSNEGPQRKAVDPAVLAAASQPALPNEDPDAFPDVQEGDLGLTDRMVSMENSKRGNLRMIKLTILSAAFSVAGLLWVILLVKMYTDWFS